MAIAVGIDFGTTNTVIARWSAASSRSELVRLPSSSVQEDAVGEEEHSFFIPSVLRCSNGRSLIGKDALKSKVGIERFFKMQVVNGTTAHHSTSLTRKFLSELFTQFSQAIVAQDTNLVLTVPNGASDDYTTLLVETAQGFCFNKVLVLHEPLAAAIGTRTDLRPGDEAIFFDCGAGTTDVSWIRYLGRESGIKLLGRCPRIFVAGNDVDRFVEEEILRTCSSGAPPELAREHATKIKELLATKTEVEVTATDEDTFDSHIFSLSQSRLVEILNRRDFYSQLLRGVKSAIESGSDNERDNDSSRISHMFFTGGSSQLPQLVSDLVERTSGFLGQDIKPVFSRPFTAVARGAAAYANGFHLEDLSPKNYFTIHRDVSDSRWGLERIVSESDPCPKQDASVQHIQRLEDRLRIAVFEASATQSNAFLSSNTPIDPHSPRFLETFKEIGHMEHIFSADASDKLTVRFDIDETRCLHIRVDTFDNKPVVERRPMCRVAKGFKG